MDTGELGKRYSDGEAIVCQGDVGNEMFVIQSGRVEVVKTEGEEEVRLGVLQSSDFFGEMALFEHEVRSATVRAVGDVRVLTVDGKTLLRRIHQDPSLAFRIVEKMSHRIRELNDEFARLKAKQ